MIEVTNVPRWRVTGDWFDVCKCTIPCPCSFAQPPTYGDCDGVLAWHIREGSYGDVRLDGLNVLMIASFVGNVWGEHSDAYAAVFLDERADEPQREALRMIFGGQAGGWLAQLTEMLGAQMRGLEYALIRVWVDDDLGTWSAEAPGGWQRGPRPSVSAGSGRAAPASTSRSTGAGRTESVLRNHLSGSPAPASALATGGAGVSPARHSVAKAGQVTPVRGLSSALPAG
ncbi:hypothetical protein LI90_3110 [Carbonactinospora thermoautotrophica]|uniref:DUF1326 domain-containing protein n=1 Tax=Carbonactinospora thermoautotrophica TaxID=1469144 RepID=A0A132MW42_9ACTN|nr:hypothetical protein LI90_3110 [Carbonactinospora thermoautotrophica]